MSEIMPELENENNQKEKVGKEQSYVRQLRALIQSGIQDQQDVLPYCPKISTDETGSVHIRRPHHETASAGLFGSSYLDEVVVSSQNKIRVANTEVGQWGPLAGQIRGPLYEGGDLNKVNINDLKLETNDFSGSHQDQEAIERMIGSLQKSLVEKLAFDDDTKLPDLYSNSIDPSNKIKYFVEACRRYPEAMKGASLALSTNRRRVFKALRRQELIDEVPFLPATINRLVRRKIQLKGGLEVSPRHESRAMTISYSGI